MKCTLNQFLPKKITPFYLPVDKEYGTRDLLILTRINACIKELHKSFLLKY